MTELRTPSRRQWLQGAAVLASLPLHAWARASTAAPQLAAAWAEGSTLWVGVLQLPRHAQAPLHVVQRHAVPTRAHGMTQLPDGRLLFASRRPGDWLLCLHPDGRAQWQWIEPDRAFNGHVVASLDGQHLYTTETDLADSQGCIGVRDVHTLEKVAEWPTGGMDPHQLLLDRDGSLLVANGGIPTQPETGRRKRRLSAMDSSLVRLQPQDSGAIAGQWRLADARLSLRHLAWGPGVPWAPPQRWLGIALQAEHDDPQARLQAPVLALWDGQQLQAAPLPAGMEWQGYGGDISSDGTRFAVSCPRADTLTWWQPPTTPGAAAVCVQQHSQPGVYCLSNPSPAQPLQRTAQTVWAGGQQQVQQFAPQARAGTAVAQTPPLALDNHWVPLP